MNRHRTGVASAVVVALAAGSMIAYALAANGYPVHRAELNDASIWVTVDQPAGAFGLMNKPVSQFDTTLYAPDVSTDIDVFQDAAAVVGLDATSGTLTPMDASGLKLNTGDAAKIGNAKIAMGGGTLAVLDHDNGSLWAMRFDPDSTIASLSPVDPASGAKPVAKVGAKAAFAVGADGSVFAVSAAGGLTTLTPGGHGFVRSHKALPVPAGDTAEVSAVGGGPVVLLAAPGAGTPSVVLPSGRTVDVPNASGAVLQQPGPANSAVVLATASRTISVGLDNGHITAGPAVGSGDPARPVYLRGCAFAAWAGAAPVVQQQCGANRPISAPLSHTAPTVAALTFRLNRQQLLLNDTVNGGVWNLDSGKPNEIDDWSAVTPPKQQQNSKTKDHDSDTNSTHTKPPEAINDTLGARAGRTNALYVLDNDSNPSGAVISVDQVFAPDTSQATVAVAPDHQSVLVTPHAGATGSFSFQYTDTDGAKVSKKATVSVNLVPDGQYTKPQTRHGFTPRTWSVPVNGVITIPVLNQWRDYGDADPPALKAGPAVKKDGSAAITTADGEIVFSAANKAGTETVGYSVLDGDKSATAQLTIRVQASTAKAVAAEAQNDYVRGTVGRPFTIEPLANDLPGSDPLHPSAHMAIAGSIKSPSGLHVATPSADGAITLTATRAGTYTLSYQVGYGAAPLGKAAKIRVDVAAASTSGKLQTGPDAVTVHGTQPSLVDVLANDFDPAGDVLAVVAATAADPAGLQVAVVRGRWLRINARQAASSPVSRIVEYTVTNGESAPVTGQVSVTELPALRSDPPLPEADYATVRAGDEVTIPVLDNDTDEGGDPISLAQDVVGAPAHGQLPVTAAGAAVAGGNGSAYVSGNLVRYVAPPSAPGATAQRTVEIDYTATANGQSEVGKAYVTIYPRATVKTDQAPQPQDLEARVVAGGKVTVVVPTSGVDPDGDTVAVQGLGSVPSGSPAPHLGALVGYTANSLTYQAFPSDGNGGTDEFTYSVTDTYGLTATATVRIAVVPPAVLPAPVAHDINLTAAPGATVRVNVVTAANVDYPEGAKPALLDPAKTSPELKAVATLDSSKGWLDIKVPSASDRGSFTVPYAVAGDLGATSSAAVIVTIKPKYVAPPVAVDQFAKAKPGKTQLSVDLLKGDSSSTGGTLKVLSPVANVTNGMLLVQVKPTPQVIPYVIADSNGGRAAAVVYVPAGVTGGAPYWNGQLIKVGTNKTATVSLAQYVVDPRGKALRLTHSGDQWASPADDLSVGIAAIGSLKLTSAKGYSGPAAVTFVVTDGAKLNEPGAQTAVITIPVQVGDPTPVLRCPTDQIDVTQGKSGGTPIDVTSVCHVWTPDDVAADSLKYKLAWHKAIRDVSVVNNDSGAPAVVADHNAKPGSQGILTISIDHYASKTETLGVTVVKAPLLTVAPIAVQGVKTGTSKPVNLSAYVSSPFGFSTVSVVSARAPAGISVTHTASAITISPHTGIHGQKRISYTVTDISDRTDKSRWVSGTIDVQVLDRPNAPTAVTPRPGYEPAQVTLTWVAPADNGSPVTGYQVGYRSSAGSGTQNCPGTTCVITHLHNGSHYVFRVRAQNAVGWSEFSTWSADGVPDVAPNAVTNLKAGAPRDHAVTLTWTPVAGPSSKVGFKYVISWSGGASGTATLTNPAANSYTVTGLDNDAVDTFTITAENEVGPNANSPSVKYQSGGKPEAPTFRSDADGGAFVASNDADGNSRDVSLYWNAVDPNGPQPVSYTVTRTSGGASKSVCTVTTTTCTDQGIGNNGTQYTYSVVAAGQYATTFPADAALYTSGASPTVRMTASATPDQVKIVSFEPTGTDGQAKVVFDVGASHGSSSTVTCTVNGSACQPSASWANFATVGQSAVTETITGLANGATSQISLSDCNGSQANADKYSGNPCSSAVVASTTTYGPFGAPSVSASASDQNVSWSVSVNPNGRAVNVSVTHHGTVSTYTSSTTGGSWSGTDTVGYSTTDTITVTVSDTASTPTHRASTSRSASATTGPPPPSITASKGDAGTAPIGSCTTVADGCHWLNFQVHNYPLGSYTWSCISNGAVSYNSTSTITISDPNQSFSGVNHCIFGSGYSEAIRINSTPAHTSNAVPF